MGLAFMGRMSAIRRLRTDEVLPPPPTEKSLREANGGVWPPKDRLVALGSLLTTKHAASGQDASLPATPRVPRFESPSPWPPSPEPHPWLAAMARVFQGGKKHALGGSAVLGAVGVSFVLGALGGALGRALLGRRGRRVPWHAFGFRH